MHDHMLRHMGPHAEQHIVAHARLTLVHKQRLQGFRLLHAFVLHVDTAIEKHPLRGTSGSSVKKVSLSLQNTIRASDALPSESTMLGASI